MPVIEGAIFDVDGTLLDSMSVWNGFGERYLARYGIQTKPGFQEIIHKLSMWEAAELFRKDYGMQKSDQEIVDELNHMIEDDYLYRVKVKPGVPEFLKGLAQKGVKMCIATATDRYQVEAALKREGILSYFEAIFTCSEVGIGKQKPDIYLQAWDKLQTPKEKTWVFEDMLYAVETARQAGFPVVAIQDGNSLKDESKLREEACYYSTSYADLLHYFALEKEK